MPQQGCSSYCQTLPVVWESRAIVPSRYFPVKKNSLEDAELGEVVLFPEHVIPKHLLLYELPNGRRFEKHRVFWAGMLKDAWLRIL